MLTDGEKNVGINSNSISLSMLQLQFHRSLVEAADYFHFSKTTFKRICRDRGICRWPYRQIRSINQSIIDLKLKAQGIGPGPNLDSLNTAIQKQELKKALVIMAASCNNEELRKTIFNLEMAFFEESNLLQILTALQSESSRAKKEDNIGTGTTGKSSCVLNFSNQNSEKAEISLSSGSTLLTVLDQKETQYQVETTPSTSHQILQQNELSPMYKFHPLYKPQNFVQDMLVTIPLVDGNQVHPQLGNKKAFEYLTNEMDIEDSQYNPIHPKRRKYSEISIELKIGLPVLSETELGQYNKHRKG